MKKLITLLFSVIVSLTAFTSCTTAFAVTQPDGISTEVVIDYNTVVRYGTPYYYNGVVSYYHYDGIYYYPYFHNNVWYVHPYRHVQPRGYIHVHRPHHYAPNIHRHTPTYRHPSSTRQTVRQPQIRHHQTQQRGNPRGNFGGRR